MARKPDEAKLSADGARPVRRLWLLLLAFYLAILVASHATRWLDGRDRVEPEGPVYAEWPGGESKRLESLERSERPVLLLLHGSPGRGGDFDRLAVLLEDRYRLIAPDLPGFGENKVEVEDYSIRAQAAWVEELLQSVAPASVHVLGFSLGGGVALELVERAPGRVESLILLSAIGPQQFELLGSYEVNHAVHGLQLAAITALVEGMPHFGAFDGMILDRGYARSFYDTDQRPLQGIAERVEAPVLIVHGRHDPLVPFEAALEHERLIPHSELVALDSDHFDLFRDPARLAGEIASFVDRVEEGSARRRSDATSERIAATLEPLDLSHVAPAKGIAQAIWIFLLVTATLVSEDLTTIAAGLLVTQGRIDFFTAVFSCFLGIFVGDALLFLAGRWLGRPWLGRRPLSWFIDETQIESASDWFRRRGPLVILLSRFMPGMRLPTYFAAGLLRTSFWRFLLYFAVAVAVWTPILVWLSMQFGGRAFEELSNSGLGVGWGFGLTVVVVWLGLTLLRRTLSRTRRHPIAWARAGFRRLVRWEFWPPYLFYLPVLVWIAWLAIRFRSLTLFSAANPGMPAGGFVGESKGEILDRLPSASVARYERLERGTGAEADDEPRSRRGRVEAFLAKHQLDFPVVLKPDVGERGSGVRIAKSWGDVDHYLGAYRGSLILQEHISGPELGVFYVRMPGERRGRIFSITEKVLPKVTGDGSSTLEELVLADPLLSLRGEQLLSKPGCSPTEVLERGEERTLVDVGTHCLGALFLDGARFHTEALEQAIDEVSRAYDGFFFGRYDLRAANVESFREGRDFKVLELNGVTSEATHIYDPNNTLLDAYRVLFRQWRIAFEIGAAQRELGVLPESTVALIRRILQARKVRAA